MHTRSGCSGGYDVRLRLQTKVGSWLGCMIRPLSRDTRRVLIPVQNILGLKARNMEDVFGVFRSASDTARTRDGSRQISQNRGKGDEPQLRLR